MNAKNATLWLAAISLSVCLGAASHGENISLVGSMYDYWGDCRSIAVLNGYLYVATAEGFRVYDVSDPANPVEVGRVQEHYDFRDIKASGNYLYITSYDSALVIYDISDPVRPSEVNRVNLPAPPIAMAVENNTVYLASLQWLMVIEVSNPNIPVVSDPIWMGGPSWHIEINGGKAIIYGDAGVDIWNLTEPQSPQLLNHLRDRRGYIEASSLVVNDTVLYLNDVTWETPSGVSIYSIANPALPILLGNDSTQEWSFDLGLMGSTLFSAGDVFRSIDVSNPTSPLTLDTLHLSVTASQIEIEGGYAYVLTQSFSKSEFIDIIDIHDPTNLRRVARLESRGLVNDVTVSGWIAYVADGYLGVKAIDVSVPDRMTEIGSCVPIWRWSDVKIMDYYVFASANNPILICDFSDPSNPREISRIRTEEAITDYEIGSRHLYTATTGHGYIHDIRDPTQPHQVGTFPISISAWPQINIIGSRLFLAYGNQITLFNLSNPSRPELLGEIPTESGFISSIEVSGPHLFAATMYDTGSGEISGVEVYDISMLRFPQYLGRLFERERLRSADIFDGHGYFQIGDSLKVYDITDPTNMIEVGSVYGGGGNFDFQDGFLYAAQGTRLAVYDCREALGIAKPPRLLLPGSASLSEFYPNPFNARARVSFDLPSQSPVSIRVFDAAGRNVSTLFEGVRTAGRHSVDWNADGVASGVYMIRLETPGHQESWKAILSK